MTGKYLQLEKQKRDNKKYTIVKINYKQKDSFFMYNKQQNTFFFHSFNQKYSIEIYTYKCI